MNNDNKMMLAVAIYAAVVTLIFNSLGANAQVQNAIASNVKKPATRVVGEDVVDFLIKSADARMMHAQGGLLAARKGTSTSIRKYGQLMMKDQSMLLKEIKKLAKSCNVSLPREMSNKKVGNHRDLSGETGSDFDEKFIKIMTAGLEQDIKLFGKAVLSGDEQVSAFAQHYLPLIQSHLNKIQEIKVERKQ
jgi:putative membrane protein